MSSDVRFMRRKTAEALKVMLIEHEVATKILEAEANHGPLKHVDLFADNIRRKRVFPQRRGYRPAPADSTTVDTTDRPFGCPPDEEASA